MARPKEAHGIPEIPPNLPPAQRGVMSQMRNAIVRLQGTRAPALPPTNLRVTPVGFGNNIDYTRSNGDSYTLWWSMDANSAHANPIPIGQQSRYVHSMGKDGVKVYYWIQAVLDNGSNSKLVGPKSGVTLLSNAAVTLPAPPPANQAPTTDITTGRPTPGGINQE